MEPALNPSTSTEKAQPLTSSAAMMESESQKPPFWLAFLGNGFCEDVFNKAEYNFDLGDCCFTEIDDTFCNECYCHKTKSRHKNLFDSHLAGKPFHLPALLQLRYLAFEHNNLNPTF